MPIAVKIPELKPGMIVARPVRNRYAVLITAGKQISQNDINRLSKLIPDGAVWIRDPVLDDALEFDDLSESQEVAARVHSIIFKQVKQIHEKLSSKLALTETEVLDLHRSINDAVSYVSEHPVSSAYLPRGDSASYLETHQMNVFFLSMLIGREIRQYMARERISKSRATKLSGPQTLVQLGMSAILHDAGLSPLKGLFAKDAKLDEPTRKSLRDHPNEGVKLLGSPVPPLVRMAIKQHHENFPGKGYPNGLKGGDVHVLARIIRLADAYEVCTAAEVFREARSHARTLYELTLGRYKVFYDKVILKILQSLIVPFEPGARVKLSNGMHAIVVKTRRLDPFRPVVQVLFDASGKRIPKESLDPPLDLAHSPIKLARLDGEDLSFLYKPDYGETFSVAPGRGLRLFNYFFP